MNQPLLPISLGHLALTLGAGVLDGRLTLDDGSTIIIKAISTKEQYQKSDTAELRAGVTYRAVVSAEKPSLLLRVLSADGVIVEYQ
jgi:hypothetical protein